MFLFSGDLDIIDNIELIQLKAYEERQVTADSTHDFLHGLQCLAFTWIQLLGSVSSAYWPA